MNAADENQYLEKTFSVVFDKKVEKTEKQKLICAAIQDLNLSHFSNVINILHAIDTCADFSDIEESSLFESLFNTIPNINELVEPVSQMTPVMFFCQNPNPKLVDVLLENGSDKNAVDILGFGLPYHAVLADSIEVLNVLLSHNISLVNVSGKEDTLLHAACSNGSTKLIEFLIKNCEVDPNLRSGDLNMNCLSVLAYYSDAPDALLLIDELGADFDSNNELLSNPFELSLLSKNFKNVHYFIKTGRGKPLFDEKDLGRAVVESSINIDEDSLNTGNAKVLIPKIILKNYAKYLISCHKNLDDFIPFIKEVENVQQICKALQITPMELLKKDLSPETARIVKIAFMS
jgi:ankyrin repeat protein